MAQQLEYTIDVQPCKTCSDSTNLLVNGRRYCPLCAIEVLNVPAHHFQEWLIYSLNDLNVQVQRQSIIASQWVEKALSLTGGLQEISIADSSLEITKRLIRLYARLLVHVINSRVGK